MRAGLVEANMDATLPAQSSLGKHPASKGDEKRWHITM